MINQRTLALTIRCLWCQGLLAASGCCTARLYFGSLNFLLGGFAGIWLALIWNLEAGSTHFLVVKLFDRTALTWDRRLDVAGEALVYKVWNSAGGGMGPWRELSWKITGLSTRLARRLVIHKFCGAWLHHFSILYKFNIKSVKLVNSYSICVRLPRVLSFQLMAIARIYFLVFSGSLWSNFLTFPYFAKFALILFLAGVLPQF